MAPKKGVSRTGLIVQAVEEHMVGGLNTFAVVAAVGAMPLTIRRLVNSFIGREAADSFIGWFLTWSSGQIYPAPLSHLHRRR